MAKLIYGLTQSLDGYVDHQKIGRPQPGLFGHFLEQTQDAAGLLYGRRTYEIMQYWDEEQDDWDDLDRRYAQAWRSRTKWVASRGAPPLGPGAVLLPDDLGAAVRELKARHAGTITVAGHGLARSLAELGLIDEYRLYFVPIALGGGTPFFAGPRPPLRRVAAEPIAEEAFRLTYVPA